MAPCDAHAGLLKKREEKMEHMNLYATHVATARLIFVEMLKLQMLLLNPRVPYTYRMSHTAAFGRL